MKIILAYEHEHDTKSISEVVVCLEGPSVEVVRDSLKELIKKTTEARFDFCGEKLYIRDFRQVISPQRLAHAAMLTKHLNKQLPFTFEIEGEAYAFKKFRVQTLDAWFEKEATVFHEPAELTFVH